MRGLARKGKLVLLRWIHSGITRDSRFSVLNETDLGFFTELLGSPRIVTDEQRLIKYNRDWMGALEGRSKLALFPRTTEEVSRILRHCNERKLAIVPQGGNTGLVQGSNPVFDEIILSTEKMDSILGFDELSGVLSCQAGCILENLGKYLSDRGHVMPLDLGAKGSCHIGGNLATNAGGLRLQRYGSLHGTVLGVEAVLSNGEVLDTMSSLRKDNTGYDLKQLFIGSEGTLGVITSVAIQCPPASPAQNVCLLSVDDYNTALEVYREAKSSLGEILSAFEFMDSVSFNTSLKAFKDIRNPLASSSAGTYLLVETLGSNDDHDKEKISALLNGLMDEGLVMDGVMAQDSSQVREIWSIRERIPEALPFYGKVFKYDVSLPLKEISHLISETKRKMEGRDCVVCGFGHMGDGNLHLEIIVPSDSHIPYIKQDVEPFIFQWTKDKRGSISAEHGLGTSKANAIYYSKTPSAVSWMKSLKCLFDPAGILNPYKVLPRD